MPDKYGNPRPGEQGYEEYAKREAGSKDGSIKPGDPNYLPGTAYQKEGGPSGGGEFDPARTGAYGNRAGYGDGSKFQDDSWGWWNGRADGTPGQRSQMWDSINGSYNPNQPGINPNAGQIGSGVNGTAQAGLMQSAGPNGMQQNQSRDMQMNLMQQLQDQAAGKGPSLAQMQLQKGTDANMMSAMALGQAQRGAGQGGMQKGIAQQQASIGQGMANDSAMLRLQEQMQARQMLGQGLQGMRGQDQGWAGMDTQNNQFNAGQGNQNGQFNAGQTNQMNTAKGQLGLDAEKMRQETALAYEKMRQQAAKDASPMGAIGGIFGAVGGM